MLKNEANLLAKVPGYLTGNKMFHGPWKIEQYGVVVTLVTECKTFDAIAKLYKSL